jgi:hypothetical protein
MERYVNGRLLTLAIVVGKEGCHSFEELELLVYLSSFALVVRG